MTDPKMIGVRLPIDVLEQVDHLAESAFKNRSDALRYIIQEGLDKVAINDKIENLNSSMNRISLILEKVFIAAFIAAEFGNQSKEIKTVNDKNYIDGVSPEKIKETIEKAKTAMTNILVREFGK